MEETTPASPDTAAAAAFVHELNNVFMGIAANLEVLRRRATPELARPINNIAAAVERGRRIAGGQR